ncbi:L,D-transpeptidase family protein [Alteribacter natronophilus]|uniref:L,D-transpeptidase family protein n=1 Tax=Alteribacter natronophilus TaxID=2583810 RepID=UPI00110F689E|nr:peptidoglycan-binding protein [Alteribacter natronophilus]TMW69887.1 N-acetylmuramoyl-L-alanine amidase [Alteribacter natronophilus]
MFKKILCSLLAAVLFTIVWQIPAASASSDQLIIINKKNNQLVFYENSKLVKTFPVATGRTASLTPEGSFKVVNKIKNRPYYKGNIPGGDPKNPLGKRWIGIDANGTRGDTYAIHGNNNPASIGTYASAGCVRMHNSDVEWLFSKVKISTKVVIVNSSNSFNQIAKANGYTVSDGKNTAVPVSGGTTLRLGSKGEAVKDLQRQLEAAGYSTKGIDGSFGPATQAAVRKFQSDKKLKVDGIAGPQTRNALADTAKKTTPAEPKSSSSPVLKRGSSGKAVSDLQRALTDKGYSTKGIDGKFGPATEAAVRNFQRANGLKVDGVAGAQTWGKLK